MKLRRSAGTKIIVYILIVWFSTVFFAYAGTLLIVSDLISGSAPSASVDHTVQFTITNDVSGGGKIVITPETGFFMPALFDYTDIDFAVATGTGNPFVQRDISGVASTTADVVSVITGSSSSMTITLRATSGIASGDQVFVRIGNNATYGDTGDQQISNPANPGSYRVDIQTKNSADQIIDEANALVYIISQVGVGPVDTIDDTSPIRSNSLPTNGALLPGGTQNVQISLETNEDATCKYSETAGVGYAAMTNFFDETFEKLHTVVMTGLVDDTRYSYYVRCIDYQSNANLDDYEITFDIGVVPLEPGSGGVTTGAGEPGEGTGGGPYDFGGQYLGNAKIVLDGQSYPSSKITILRDGESESILSVGSSGKFNTTVENLTRGTYTFSFFAEDANGKKSSTYTSTISISADTGNTISRIFLAPTVDVENDTLDQGEDLAVFGYAIPESFVEVFFGKQARISGESTIVATTTTSGDGKWNVVFDTKDLSLETYIVKARSTVSGENDPGDFSQLVYVGIGGEPEPDFSLRADLNQDEKVNIVDFSILLFNWGTDDDVADINLDSNVDLTDFSIMVFYWTG